jgi:anti-sigma B factor antagonist
MGSHPRVQSSVSPPTNQQFSPAGPCTGRFDGGNNEPMSTPLRLGIDVQRVSGHPVLAVTGEIDIYTAPLFKQAVVNLVSEGANDVVIDLSGVTFMDSSGFGTLLGATRRLRPLGGGLHLAGANSTIQRMLRLTRLDTIMQLYDSPDDAVKSISGTGTQGQQQAA